MKCESDVCGFSEICWAVDMEYKSHMARPGTSAASHRDKKAGTLLRMILRDLGCLMLQMLLITSA